MATDRSCRVTSIRAPARSLRRSWKTDGPVRVSACPTMIAGPNCPGVGPWSYQPVSLCRSTAGTAIEPSRASPTWCTGACTLIDGMLIRTGRLGASNRELRGAVPCCHRTSPASPGRWSDRGRHRWRRSRSEPGRSPTDRSSSGGPGDPPGGRRRPARPAPPRRGSAEPPPAGRAARPRPPGAGTETGTATESSGCGCGRDEGRGRGRELVIGCAAGRVRTGYDAARRSRWPVPPGGAARPPRAAPSPVTASPPAGQQAVAGRSRPPRRTRSPGHGSAERGLLTTFRLSWHFAVRTFESYPVGAGPGAPAPSPPR